MHPPPPWPMTFTLGTSEQEDQGQSLNVSLQMLPSFPSANVGAAACSEPTICLNYNQDMSPHSSKAKIPKESQPELLLHNWQLHSVSICNSHSMTSSTATFPLKEISSNDENGPASKASLHVSRRSARCSKSTRFHLKVLSLHGL